MNINKITKQAIEAFEHTLTPSELTELADIFVSLSKRNTPQDDKKAMLIWKCIGTSQNPANIAGFHGAKSTCGRGINREIVIIMNRTSINSHPTKIEKAFKALRTL